MIECCLSGQAWEQSDLVLASILRVVMAVMASQPQIGAADCGLVRPHFRRKKTLHLSSRNGTSKLLNL